MNRTEERTEFAFELGLALKPVLDVIENPALYDDAERRRIRAQYARDHGRLHSHT